MTTFVENATIKPGYRSDHSLVEITLKLNNQQKAKGLWKLNNTLLKDNTYVNEIRQKKTKININL
jgi:hypothetical protein